MDALLDAIVALAHDLPNETVEALASALSRVQGVAEGSRVASLVVTSTSAQERVRQLIACWTRRPELSGPAIAMALRSANRMDDHYRQGQRIELVWTGPVPAGTSFRRSDQVLLEMVRESRHRVTIVSFATYRVPSVHAALLDAAERGVDIVFIAESPEESGGRVNTNPLKAIGEELGRRARTYVWPREKRPEDAAGNFGLLHAKCAIADGNRLLVSSANFTSAALETNMELGVLIEGGEVPGTVERHWARLVTMGVLASASR